MHVQCMNQCKTVLVLRDEDCGVASVCTLILLFVFCMLPGMDMDLCLRFYAPCQRLSQMHASMFYDEVGLLPIANSIAW